MPAILGLASVDAHLCVVDGLLRWATAEEEIRREEEVRRERMQLRAADWQDSDMVAGCTGKGAKL